MNYWQFYPDRRTRLGHRAGVGLRHRRAVAASGRGGGRAALRLLAHVRPGRAATRPPDGLRLQRRRAAPRRAARGLQPVLALQRRPVLMRRHRRRAGAAAAAVHHLLADRRFPGRQRLLRRPHGAAVQRVEQDRLRHRLPAAPATGHRGGRPDVRRPTGRSAKAWAATTACSPTRSSTRCPPIRPASTSISPAMRELRRSIHTRFANLKYSCSIGGTHVEQLRRRQGPARPARHAVLRAGAGQEAQAEWGAAELGKRLVQAWRPSARRSATATRPGSRCSTTAAPKRCRPRTRRCWRAAAIRASGHILSLT